MSVMSANLGHTDFRVYFGTDYAGGNFDVSCEVASQCLEEEGGFYVISLRDGKLYLEHEFHYFKDFMRIFYER